MSFPFFVHIIALLFSLFVCGAMLGALFSKSPVGKKAIVFAKNKLRVLMFGWEFPPFNSGGLGVACFGLTRALSKKDIDLVFVMPKRLPSGVPFAKFVSAGIDTVRSESFENLYPFASEYAINSPVAPYDSSRSYVRREDGLQYENGSLVYGSDLVSEARRYARLGGAIASREPHDFIYAHDWLSFGAGREAKRVSQKPFLAHVHSTEFDRTGGDNVDQNIYDLERAGMHTADKVITVSGKTKQTVLDRYSVPDHKVHVVWNGIDDTTAPAPHPDAVARLSALKKSGYKIVLFMGRITIQKGPDYFVRSARRVIDRDPNVLFILAGSGDMERQMMHLAASLGIGDKVLFPGFLRGHEQYEAYALADLFVMPSVSEPFGLTALEAMRIGTPVIVSKQSGVAEAVTHALKVDFWDIEKMTDLMLSVLESPKLHSELKKKGIAEASTLTWDRSADEIRTIMDNFAHV
jgi:glycosyltransferase involved in cell wall biosynthesis